MVKADHVPYNKEPAWIKCGDYKKLRAPKYKKAFALTKEVAGKYPDEYKFVPVVIRDHGMHILVTWRKRTNETIDEPYLSFVKARWYRSSGVRAPIRKSR